MKDEERRRRIIKLAQAEYAFYEVSIQKGATISEGDDNGCYVAAWAWVSFEGTEFDKENLTCV